MQCNRHEAAFNLDGIVAQDFAAKVIRETVIANIKPVHQFIVGAAVKCDFAMGSQNDRLIKGHAQ
jgi:hypothetical protein